MTKITELIAHAKSERTEYKEHEFGFIPNWQSQQILQITQIRVHGVKKILTSDVIRHIFKEHGNNKDQGERGQMGITDADIEKIPNIVANFDSVEKANPKHGKSVLFIKEINGISYRVAMKLLGNQGDPKLEVRTMFAKPIKKAGV